MRVIDAVAEVMARPFEWGRCDCCTAACDVFARLTGVDPMAPFRGAYAGPVQAGRLMRDAGGLQAMAQEMADAHGLQPCAWHPGALGLAHAGPRGALVLVIGLDQPGAWAGKSRGGWSVWSGDVVAAWRN